MESIYVTPDGEWKLGRLDCVNRIAQNSKDHILSISDLCDSNIYPVPPANEQVSGDMLITPCAILYALSII